MEQDFKLLPERPKPTNKNAFQKKVRLHSNFYSVLLRQQTNLCQFVLDSEPIIPDDSIQLLRSLVNHFKEALQAKIGLISHKGKILWGTKPLDKAFVMTETIKEIKYQVIIKPTRIFYEADVAKLRGNQLKNILHIYKVAVHQKLMKLGLAQIKRGIYIKQDKYDNQNIIKDKNIQVLRTYQLRFVSLARGLSMQIDVGSRILRLQNFAETLSSLKSQDEKMSFIGQIVQCNYGKNMTFRIEDLKFDLNPQSQFYLEKEQKKVSFAKYFQQKYRMKIKTKNQPLIMVTSRIDRKTVEGKLVSTPVKGYLIPQFVRLTGIPEKLQNDKNAKKQISQFTKMVPDKRYQLSRDLIEQFNKEKGSLTVQKCIQIDGFVLPDTTITTSSNQYSKYGQFAIKDKVKQPMRLTSERWLFAYSSFRKDHIEDEEAQMAVKLLKKAQDQYGIVVQDPVYVVIQKRGADQWKRCIKKQIRENDLIVLLFFDSNQINYYGEIKRFLTNEIQVASQALLKKTFRQEQGRSLTAAGKVICQMNAKLGMTLWSVKPRHPFWQGKTIMYGALSISRGKGCQTLAFVGTYSKDLTKVYSNSRTNIPLNAKLSAKDYQQVMIEWIKRYYQIQNSMPDIIILYREGLSEQQIKVQGQVELAGLEAIISRASKKQKDYNPQLLYIAVNKGITSRFYQSKSTGNQTSNKFRPKFDNPEPGTVVFENLSCENAYDFHLAAQRVTQGTCTPTHYRIAYDASKIPQEAIAQFTYQQCYNYYNWEGAVRVPACLQNADKLSKLVGEHIRQNVIAPNLQKTPYFL